MKKENMLEKLDEAYERGLKGRVDSFDIWLRDVSIDPTKFTKTATNEHLLSHPEETINREEELQSIIEFIGFYKRNKQGLFYIPVIGVTGIGKSHIIRTIEAFLKKMEKDLTWLVLDAKTFSTVDEDLEENQPFLDTVNQIRSYRYDILFIDSCDEDKAINDSLRALSNTVKSGVIITAWTPYHWDGAKADIEEFLTISKEIHVKPLNREATSVLIDRILSFMSSGKFDLSNDVDSLLFAISRGIPSVIISLLLRSFHEAFQKKKQKVETQAVKSAARYMGLIDVKEKIAKLADHQVLVLKHILLSFDERGIRPSTLVDILGKDKATISYHLGALLQEEILTTNKIGRWVFYQVRKDLEPFVGLRIAEESDYLG